MKHIEIIARGVCVMEGQVLLCHTKGAENTYLPGGHVEFGERAAASLEREIDEELGLPARTGGFLGAAEHTFLQKGKRHCEINLVFALEVDGIAAGRPVEAAEAHIDFLWAPVNGLAAAGLEPSELRDRLAAWLEEGEGSARWASTY